MTPQDHARVLVKDTLGIDLPHESEFAECWMFTSPEGQDAFSWWCECGETAVCATLAAATKALDEHVAATEGAS